MLCHLQMSAEIYIGFLQHPRFLHRVVMHCPSTFPTKTILYTTLIIQLFLWVAYDPFSLACNKESMILAKIGSLDISGHCFPCCHVGSGMVKMNSWPIFMDLFPKFGDDILTLKGYFRPQPNVGVSTKKTHPFHGSFFQSFLSNNMTPFGVFSSRFTIKVDPM